MFFFGGGKTHQRFRTFCLVGSLEHSLVSLQDERQDIRSQVLLSD